MVNAEVFRKFFPVILIGIGSLTLACCDRSNPSTASSPPRPSLKPGEPPRPPRISEEEATWIFREILRIHRDWALIPKFCGTLDPWLSQEKHEHRTEGRLFARAYPLWAERSALEILKDPEAPWPDRRFAWFILGILAPRTTPDLEEFLAQRTEDTDDLDAHYALSCLAGRVRDERCLALCLTLCKQGNSVAFDILTEVADPAAVALLEKMTHWPDDGPYPIGSIPHEAQEALRRIDILKSRDWESRIKKIILGKGDDRTARDLYWAIRLAHRRGMPSLKETLKERLTGSRKEGEPIHGRISYPEDFDYDHVLVSFAKEGGELLPQEEEYLKDAGFYGDSEERLLRIVSKWGQYTQGQKRRPQLTSVPLTANAGEGQGATSSWDETLILRPLTPGLRGIPGLEYRLARGGPKAWSGIFFDALPSNRLEPYRSLAMDDLAVLAEESLRGATDVEVLVRVLDGIYRYRLERTRQTVEGLGRSPDPRVRAAAGRVLIRLAGPRSLEIAEPFLKDATKEVRQAAIDAVAIEHPAGAGARLLQMTSNPEVTYQLAGAFWHLRDPAGLPFLRKLCLDETWDNYPTRNQAAMTLGYIGGPEEAPLFRSLLKWMKTDPNTSDSALMYLSKWGDRESIPLIEKAIESDEMGPNGPYLAARALYRMGAKSSTQALLRMARKTQGRDAAFRTLGLMGCRDAVGALRGFLDPPDPTAIITLAELEDLGSIRNLRTLLDHKDRKVREAACTALAILGDEESAPVIAKMGKEAYPARRIFPIYGLRDCPDGAILGMTSGHPVLWDSEYYQHELNGSHNSYSYINIIGAATARARVDLEILREMMNSDSGSDLSLSSAVALTKMGYCDGARLLIDSDSMVFGLNVLRNPLSFRKLEQKPVTWRLYATYEEIHRKLASEAGLILEGPPEGTHAHQAWKNVHHRLWKWGRAPSLAEAFEMVEDYRWSVVLENDRIRIVPTDQARELWTRWLASQPK